MWGKWIVRLGAGLCAAFVGAAAVAQDRPPEWLRTPSSARYLELWPAEAYRRGVGGKVILTCELSPEGGLRKCAVTDESPPGLGFGGAALSLSSEFRLKPRMKDGKPVVSSISVPIRFGELGGGTGSHIKGGGAARRVLTLPRPVWSRAPTKADMEAAYPAKAKAAGGGRGFATLECVARADGTLRHCTVESEEPRGMGFGGAAKSLADRFVVTPPTGQADMLNGARVRAPFQFDPPGSGAGDLGGAGLKLPAFSAMPDAARMAALYPAAARAAGVKEGRAAVECLVQPGGALGGCSVASETPAGLGFGEAALALAGSFALTPWTEDGKPTAGARIRVPLRYVDPQASSATDDGGTER
jgi:TonB family protein